MKTLPVIGQAQAALQATPEQLPDGALVDRLGRVFSDLRISVTDRCNFRCRYCMPREHFDAHFQFLPRHDLLSFEELARVARTANRLGASKLRLTGGEPLLRRELPKLVRLLREHTDCEIALTTNGVLLPKLAGALAEAGLDRVTVSLDALDNATFRRMVDADFDVSAVLDGIRAAERAGFRSLKVNCVVQRGVNEHSVLELAAHFRGTGHVLRFIEYMDVGATNDWRRTRVLGKAEILEQLDARFPLETVEPRIARATAQRYRYRDGAGEIGIIASVTEPFCGDCSRARLTADGKLFTCLFAAKGTDLRQVLRTGVDDDTLLHSLAAIWSERSDRYSELRASERAALPRAEMSYLGG